MARKAKPTVPAAASRIVGRDMPTPLDDQVGYVLRRAQLAVFRDFVQRMAPVGLRPSPYSILTLLDARPGLTQIQVCQMLDIKRPNLVRLIDELERRDLVVRGKDATDRRSYSLQISPEGRRILKQAQPIHEEHERWIDQQLRPAGKQALLDLTTRLAQLDKPITDEAELGDPDEMAGRRRPARPRKARQV
jgi:DNA-binding MarR family transcriptional regulator